MALIAPRSRTGTRGAAGPRPAATSCSASATRRSTATSGSTSGRAAYCTGISAAPRSATANATATATVGAGSPGKRPITTRPVCVDARARIGDWEGDTILGADGTRPCVLSLVERKTGYVLLGQLSARTTAAVQQLAATLLARPAHPLRTLTLDNGTEFHGYTALEAVTGARVYFARPHHAWERGINENTNGLVR